MRCALLAGDAAERSIAKASYATPGSGTDGMPTSSANPRTCCGETLRRRAAHAREAARAIAPVDAAHYAAFLPRWHGLDQPRRGPLALRDAIGRLEGVALPFSELEQRILPARIADYHPRMLDELGAAGELAWVGAGALGAKDGRVVLLRRGARASSRPSRCRSRITPRSTTRSSRTCAPPARRSWSGSWRAPTRDRTAVTAALWDLVWAGLVTNDTFAPLRSLAAPNRSPGLRTCRVRRSLVARRIARGGAVADRALARAGRGVARALGRREPARRSRR